MRPAKPGQARPGNALDAASSRRMSHRRYGKPVRLGYKGSGPGPGPGPDSLARSLARSLRRGPAGVFSVTLSSPCYNFPSSLPLHRPLSCLFSITAVSTFLSILSLSLSLSLFFFSSRVLLSLLYRDLAGQTAILGILNRLTCRLFSIPGI